MPAKQSPAPASQVTVWPIFPVVAGLFFFVVILKFSSPVIMDRYIDAPTDLTSAVYGLWPPHWGTWLFVPVALAGLLAIEWNQTKLHWALLLPLIWLGWEFMFPPQQTVSPAADEIDLTHFIVCVSLFYLGFFAGKGMSNPWPVWAGMGLALVLGHAGRDGTALRRA
jgi:hypothetical protein